MPTAEAVYKKLTEEHQQAQARATEATSSVNQAATAVVTALFELEVRRLAVWEEQVMQHRAKLRRISQWWPNGKMLPISEFASSTLVNAFDFDRLRFMGNAKASEPWQQLLEQLAVDPDADFAQLEDSAANAEAA